MTGNQNLCGDHLILPPNWSKEVKNVWASLLNMRQNLFKLFSYIFSGRVDKQPPKTNISGASWSEITNLQIFLDAALFLMRVCETTTLISSSNPSLQNMDATGFRVCLKELYETRYDPVSVGYVVLGGQSMQKALDFMIANCHVFIRSSFTNYVICTDVTCNNSLAFFI